MNQFLRNIAIVLLLPVISYSQEQVAPLYFNAAVNAVNAKSIKPLLRTTAEITDTVLLPFFDDFTTYNVFPDNTKWVDKEAYVNNTMCYHPPTRGVATMDALDEHGLPYDTANNSVAVYADSLTSVPLDLSALTPADSIYISFFYQPQGLGFYPLPRDSLMLFLHRKNNDWVKIWSMPGNTVTPFMQVMIPVTDTFCFYKGFQFRFVNISVFNYSGSQWNIDYVRMNAGRNMFDTTVNDVSYNTDPTPFLNDYTAMPYRQFLVNPSAERAVQFSDTLFNYTGSTQTIPYGYTAKETTTNTPLSSSGTSSVSVPPYSLQGVSYSNYTTTIPSPGVYKKVVFQNTYYLQSPAIDTNKKNDTLVKQTVFDNYLAYDDGTAEKSYFLNLFSSLPGYVAIEYHLNQPDTIRGLSIYFGRQVPIATLKTMSFFIYSHLQGINGSLTTDSVYWQDGYTVKYADTINHFWTYKFSHPVAMPAGTFYAGVFQPAFSGSDSIYYGLDVNRIGGNHVYYNVLNVWNSSTIQGAVMIRPVIGQDIWASDVANISESTPDWTIYPNPAYDNVQLTVNSAQMEENKRYRYIVTDLFGRELLAGDIRGKGDINISALPSGIYFVRLITNANIAAVKKFIKE